jgi:hypothetical protein
MRIFGIRINWVWVMLALAGLYFINPEIFGNLGLNTSPSQIQSASGTTNAVGNEVQTQPIIQTKPSVQSTEVQTAIAEQTRYELVFYTILIAAIVVAVIYLYKSKPADKSKKQPATKKK